MTLILECEREADGRWLAEVPELPGVIVYGTSADDAIRNAQVLALRVMAERLEHGEAVPTSMSIALPVAASVADLPARPGGYMQP